MSELPASANSANSTDTRSRAHRIGCLVIAAILFLIIRHPWTQGGATPTVLTGLAIFVSCGFLWLTEALPLAITALLIPILAVGTRTMTPTDSLSAFAHPLIFLYLGGFGIAAALSYQGIDRWLAHRLIQLAGGRFLTSACALCVATAAISMWISNTATAAMIFPVALGMLGELEDTCPPDVRRRAGLFLLLGLAYSASIGGIATIVGTPPSAIAAKALDLDFAGWAKIGVPITLIFEPLCLVVLWMLFPVSKTIQMRSRQSDFRWTAPRIATLVIFLLTAVAWLGSSFIAEWLGGIKELDTMIALCALVLLAVTGLVGWKEIDRTTEWGVLLLFGGGITLGNILDKAHTGAGEFIANGLATIAGSWPPVFLVAAVSFMVIFLTELTSNTATTFLFVPLFYSVAETTGIDPAKLVIPVAIAASCAFMLPVATPPNAIIFGSGLVPQREMIRAGLRLNLLFGTILVVYAMIVL